jgi:glutamyl endopeptidase
MAQKKHERVSSSGESDGYDNGGGEAGGDPHESVSGSAPQNGDGGGDGQGGQGQESVAEDFKGDLPKGELERVTGFESSGALNEGQAISILTEDLASLPSADAIVAETFGPETVCGADGRVRVTPCTAIPWRWICQLFITMPDGAGFRGTGWFIGPRCVMTAGHCVYSKANGGWAKKIEVIPGMDGASRPYGSSVGTKFNSVVGWTTNSDPNYDYGCIILPAPLGNTVGWFGFANLNDSTLQGMVANNSGYAGDKPVGTQWFNAGTITTVTDRKIYYMLDTYGGQSGSPVWRFANNQRHAVGIHAYGGCPNSATRINAAVFNNMNNWRNL